MDSTSDEALNAGKLATARIKTVAADDPVSEVERLFDEEDLSFVPVMDANGKCFGVISCMDLLRFDRDGRNPKAEHAWEICSHNIIEVNSDDSLDSIVASMLDHDVHHLVVVEGDKITGIISSLDIVKRLKSNL